MAQEVPEPDGILAARARQGDREAFAELVRRFQRPLFAKALASARNLDDADDLVQETFLRAWQGLKGVREDNRIGPWLFRILENLAVDRGRRRGREIAGIDGFAEQLADQRPGAVEAMVTLELQRRVNEQLRTMPEGRKREIFRMRFVEGRAVDEIADELGVHSGTIKVHLFRGIREMRRRLGLGPQETT